MQSELRAILLRDNPWLVHRDSLDEFWGRRVPGKFIPRLGLEHARQRWTDEQRAHLLIGPRQAGKSTAIWAHLRSVGQPALFIDCEQALVQAWCHSAPLFLDDLEGLVDSVPTLFFDEVQHLEEAGLFFKGLVDRRIGAPLLITGSSSYHLGARTRESLAGRASRSSLFPFSLEELCADFADMPKILRRNAELEAFERQLIVGGYPAVWLADNPETLLTDLLESIILRDASDLFNIARPEAFRRLLRLMAGQVGNLINVSEWASILGVSRDTVMSYLTILEETHVAVALPPFAGGRRSEITSRPKIFLLDNGIRNRLVHDFRPWRDRADLGMVLENWVFGELWKVRPRDSTLHFWRSTSKAEVDFVLASGSEFMGIEVKASAMAKPKIPKSSRSFIEAYEPADFLIVNLGLEHREQLGKTTLEWILPTTLASRVKAWKGAEILR